MALKDLRFEVPFNVAFERGLVLVGEIEPDTEYNQNRNAPARQKVDPVTGLRQWKATCTNPAETNHKKSTIQVIFLADVAPIPSTEEVLPGMRSIVLENVTLQPKVTGQGEFKTLGWTVRATGIVGDNSGAKVPAADPGAARPARGQSDKAA
ncbi:hypothetical protein [Nocardia cerradoensis]|uniref:Plasmid replication, integration and excision activator n=1 Tax=Nocardia cerradoensis TaxID=85688 RepID=A0A231GU93_9NOCA|nr:hypothetical protein [Nocardia cerradoensis]NKY47840.1 hypothetical protein [Nocardia cerradoensis]OXR40189.1 hypothetical protein B7C42_07703 [Nocardia cerradoensis]